MAPSQLFLPRAVGALYPTALDTFRVVVLTGPRQAGKSTFVRMHPMTSGHPYFTLDDPATVLRARRDPAAFVRSEPQMVIDEVQREPSLVLAIKALVDEWPVSRRGKIVLTGSANLLMMKHVGDSLAGRAYYLRLWPLTRREQLGFGVTGSWSRFFDVPRADWLDMVRSDPAPAEDWHDAVRRGGFPAVALDLRDPGHRALWFEGYVATYLERDLRDLHAVGNLRDFQALMQVAALRIGNLLNVAELARDVRLPQSTAHQYVNLLETSFQLARLQPFARNRTSRLIKTPKIYWADVGLALHLSGGEPSGAHLENLVFQDLVAWRDTETPRPEISFWRTASGSEVDFIIERRKELLAVEVKAGSSVSTRELAHLRRFREEHGNAVRGALVLHGGERAHWVADDVLAVPWWQVL